MTTSADHVALRQLLGRRPFHIVSTPVRCANGHPCVVTTHPLQQQRRRVVLFPTLYWLTCPHLSKRVDELERQGVIKQMESELACNRPLQAAFERDHQACIAARDLLLSPADRATLAQLGMLDRLNAGGIGGMRSRTAIKCLHLHLAHHLAAHNVIGQLLVDRYSLHPC